MSSHSVPADSIHQDIYAYHGRRLLDRFIAEDSSRQGRSGANIPVPPPAVPPSAPRPSTTTADKKLVGILGAGPGGLYTALLLDFMNIPFKVIEARDRVGGRLYTHTFPDSTGAPYNYFDVGAMRFPKTTAMWRLWKLFERKELGLKERLQKYYFVDRDGNSLLSFNGVTLKRSQVPTGDAFNAASLIQDTDDAARSAYIKAGAEKVMSDVIRPFANGLLNDLEHNQHDGWDEMMKYDHYSVRSYMGITYRPSAKLAQEFGLPDKPIPTDVISWYETVVSSTGMFDRSLTDYVLEEISFGWQDDEKPKTPTEWSCVVGGANEIANSMYQYLKGRHPDAFSFKKRVTGIRIKSDAQGEGVFVTINNKDEIRFTHIITTIPLPVLRTIDLTDARLSPMQLSALRQLTYMPATKIGMQFLTAWWTNGTDKNGHRLGIVGGQSYTDSPLRTIVYPSFGDVGKGQATTLIASFTWTDDAERFSALVAHDQETLTDLTLRELARIHNVEVAYLRSQLIGVLHWDWSQDLYTMGAFAQFGPGKFKDLYKNMILPAGNERIFFAGEALSLRHAWVEGALDSAWRAVADFCWRNQLNTNSLIKEWGIDGEYAPSPQFLGSDRQGKLPSGKPDGNEGRAPGQEIDVGHILRNSPLFKYLAANSQ